MKSTRTAWLFMMPTLVILVFIGLVPFIYVLYIGFFDWNLFSKIRGMSWAGLNNYRKLVFDSDFNASLGRGALFTVLTVSIEMVLGILLANLLMMKIKGIKFFRAIHSLPLTVAPIAIGAAWRLMTLPGLGPVPYYLQKIGFDFNIGRYAQQAFFTTVIMDIWHWTPFITLAFLAGLSSLPKSPFESAMVDGANRWQIQLHITLPLLKPVILTVLFLRIMDALRIVDEVWMLTGGGPGTATRYIGIHIWRVVFPKTDYGYGSAMSVIVLYFTIVLTWLLITSVSQSRKEVAK